MPTHTLGIIADTHGLLRPEALAALQGVDQIIHAGDVGKPEILATLAQIAPVTAIRGNVDWSAWAAALPATVTLHLPLHVPITGEQVKLYVIHDRKELDFDPIAAGYHAVISGHSHRPLSQTTDGLLWLNPGAAGPRRFNLSITLARLTITTAATGITLHPTLVDLTPPP